MTESQARLVDSMCKIVATIALVVGGGWTLYTYFNARTDEAHTAAIEARKPFLAKRLEVYGEVVDLAAKIASKGVQINDLKIPKNSKSSLAVGLEIHRNSLEGDYKDEARRLFELNVGQMALVEDSLVEIASVNFGACVRDMNCPNITDRAQDLAHACRDSIGAGWQVNLSTSPVTKENLQQLKH
jgi:hypothetical protein